LAIKYLDAKRIRGTAAERAALETVSLTSIPQTSWKELGRYTLTAEGAEIITVGNGDQEGTDGLGTGTFAAKDNLMVLSYFNTTASGTYQPALIFNGDDGTSGGTGGTGNRYADRSSRDGASDSTSGAGTDKIHHGVTAHNDTEFVVSHINNLQNKEKLVITHNCFSYEVGSSASDNIVRRRETVGKWVNTSAQIQNISILEQQTQGFGDGSEVVVLGYDNDEADGGGATNFWQEIGKTVAVGTEKILSVAIPSHKKYLMFEVYKIPSGTCSCDLLLNGDDGTSAEYSWRISTGGGTDAAYNGSRLIIDNGSGSGTPSYSTGYIFNILNKEKLCMAHSVTQNTAGDTSPVRRESVGKWSNTDSVITSVDAFNPESGTFAAGSFIRVWGSL